MKGKDMTLETKLFGIRAITSIPGAFVYHPLFFVGSLMVLQVSFVPKLAITYIADGWL